MNQLAPTSFLDSLDGGARELLLAVARPMSYARGATIVHHGDPARGAYVLGEGEAEAIVTRPGGEELVVAKFTAGGVFGEMALVESGVVTATVRVTAAATGWFIATEDFRALVARSDPAALQLQHAVTMILADKLAALNVQLLACAAPEDLPARRAPRGVDPLAGVERKRIAPFDVAPFHPKLAFFEHFAPDEADVVTGRSGYVEIARGGGIFAADTPSSSVFVVLRGAAEVIMVLGECERRIAVIGPGQMVGFLGVLRGNKHANYAFARESSLFLDIPAGAFREIYFGNGRASIRLRAAVQRNLLASMAHTNRSLTRLLAQAELAAG
ncbi:MAG TPA: cyclic nucleotide-binding domain-containing protein [Usitatibacter sp.]|nr:cyclic nucleotide-binding domain-containing protein [Usitatibacter sp.]